MTQIPNKQYYRPDEAAKYIGVHVETIRRWIREVKLSTVKTCGGYNRIPKREMERILNPKGMA